MRRFLITSQKYTGEADVLYDTEGRLVKIDLMGTDMTPGMVQGLKAKIPVLVESLAEAFRDSAATIVETTYEVTFEMFWKAYDKKINKKRCEPIWAKLNTAERVRAYEGVKDYDKYLKKDTWRPKADPEKYLKDRYWENEWK
jgi:hypothetical protein